MDQGLVNAFLAKEDLSESDQMLNYLLYPRTATHFFSMKDFGFIILLLLLAMMLGASLMYLFMKYKCFCDNWESSQLFGRSNLRRQPFLANEQRNFVIPTTNEHAVTSQIPNELPNVPTTLPLNCSTV